MAKAGRPLDFNTLMPQLMNAAERFQDAFETPDHQEGASAYARMGAWMKLNGGQRGAMMQFNLMQWNQAFTDGVAAVNTFLKDRSHHFASRGTDQGSESRRNPSNPGAAIDVRRFRHGND
jgi:hypothetical protein